MRNVYTCAFCSTFLRDQSWKGQDLAFCPSDCEELAILYGPAKETGWHNSKFVPIDGEPFRVPIETGYDRCYYFGDGTDSWVYYKSDREDSQAFGPRPKFWTKI